MFWTIVLALIFVFFILPIILKLLVFSVYTIGAVISDITASTAEVVTEGLKPKSISLEKIVSNNKLVIFFIILSTIAVSVMIIMSYYAIKLA
jgi:hypothetical protein